MLRSAASRNLLFMFSAGHPLPARSTAQAAALRPNHTQVRWQHLDARGNIPDNDIRARLALLDAHGMLEHVWYFQGRLVYRNFHLFDAQHPKNSERLRQGLAPTSHDGDGIVVHHLDQTQQGAWVVLTDKFHKQKDDELHTTTAPTSDPVRRNSFNRQRKKFWQEIYKSTHSPQQDNEDSDDKIDSLVKMANKLRFD